MVKVLAIVAHPDDEVLGAGGALAKHARLGDDVNVAILGEGSLSRKSGSAKEASMLQTAGRDAAKALGARSVSFFGLPDNRFDSLARLEITKKLEPLFEALKPDVVYTHHWGDLNVDHRRTLDAVLPLARPFSSSVSRVLCFETLSATEWNCRNDFSPNYFVKLEQPDFERKLRALKCYKSELRPFPHPRSPECVEALAKVRGANCGSALAEAFEAVRLIS